MITGAALLWACADVQTMAAHKGRQLSKASGRASRLMFHMSILLLDTVGLMQFITSGGVEVGFRDAPPLCAQKNHGFVSKESRKAITF